MALRHCMHLDERRDTRLAVGPHALAFLFATASGNQPGGRDVAVGTRPLFDYDDVIDTTDLSAVLDTLHRGGTRVSTPERSTRGNTCATVSSRWFGKPS